MPNPPPRKRFQIHLSTAIVMMFVAGALMWASVRTEITLKDNHDADYISVTQEWKVITYGWPQTAFTKIEYSEIQKDGSSSYQFPPRTEINTGASVVDVATISLFLLIVWIVCEYLIRRRVAQKKS